MQIILAPIKGITDAVFRTEFAKRFGGVDAAIAPFVSSVSSRKLKNNYLKDFFPERNRQMPVVPQIISNKADDFLFMARKIAELGYPVVNWNLGCPTPMVAGKRRGSGLLPDPDAIDRFLDEVLSQLEIQLSIKTRIGRFSSEEIFQLIPIFNRYSIQELIIHPRLGIQMYSGSVDLDIWERCLPQIVHPLVYNGDIVDEGGFFRLSHRYPAISRWMIGRGLLMQPDLAERLKGLPQPDDNRRRCLDFHAALFDQYASLLSGPGHLLNKMKAIWEYFSGIFEKRDKVRKLIQKSKNIRHYQENVVQCFEDLELFEEKKDD